MGELKEIFDELKLNHVIEMGLTKRDFILAFIFTQVEVVVLTAWLYVLFPSLITSSAGLLAVIILNGGLFLEHIISRIKG